MVSPVLVILGRLLQSGEIRPGGNLPGTFREFEALPVNYRKLTFENVFGPSHPADSMRLAATLAGNRVEIARTEPSHLSDLLNQYQQVRFDLFHGGYP